MEPSSEFNFDGLVGPTHNYAGLSSGNLASTNNAASLSSPRNAALEGLEKMRRLHDLGFPQAVLPPQHRPDTAALRSFGFDGPDDASVLQRAFREAPSMLAACSSASAMWTANACTVTPSTDTTDGRVHLTPANLLNKLHRALEAETTWRILKAIFDDPAHFTVHPPLPGGSSMSDEGAANHTRLCASHGVPGLHVFVYGRVVQSTATREPSRFPARQTLEASQAIARRHRIPPERCLFIQQNPDAIDSGVFHNDVISVGHQEVFFAHQHAFLLPDSIASLTQSFEHLCGTRLNVVNVPASRVSYPDAIRSYLFNSQLLKKQDGPDYLLVAPRECAEIAPVARYLDDLVHSAQSPIREVLFTPLRESMKNGGGPACLRQRIVLNAAEQKAVKANVFFSESLYRELRAWIEKHYRESISPSDLADPRLLDESRAALDELTRILQLPGNIYPFQQA